MSLTFAGSAIKQGSDVGQIDCLSFWYRQMSVAEPLWLLLAGASDPPNGVNISGRRTRDKPGAGGGTFLPGVARDLTNVEETVGSKLFNTVKDLYITKSAAFGHIKRLFDTCKRRDAKPVLYYTGHGEIGTGNWCFADGTISIQEIFDMVPGGVFYPMIFSDACYSGHWANFCCTKNIAGFNCLAACPEYSTAVDTRGEGGDLTLFMTGKKPRPSTEPMYSGGNRNRFGITFGYDKVFYTDFITSHLRNSGDILICQSICDGYFSGCFAPSKRYSPRPAITWVLRRNYDTFLEAVKEEWERKNGESQQIYSLACDEELGFGVFFMANYGTAQTIIMTDNSNVVDAFDCDFSVFNSDIQKKYDEGFMITACAARGSTFYVIMTKDTEEYKGKTQTWITSRSWVEAESKIQKEYNKGKAITGICYSTSLVHYGIVMTGTSKRQTYEWFCPLTDPSDWMNKKYQQGYHPTIIFREPTDHKNLIVMTSDEYRSGYTIRLNHGLKNVLVAPVFDPKKIFLTLPFDAKIL